VPRMDLQRWIRALATLQSVVKVQGIRLWSHHCQWPVLEPMRKPLHWAGLCVGIKITAMSSSRYSLLTCVSPSSR
jgi:hypothetical protein